MSLTPSNEQEQRAEVEVLLEGFVLWTDGTPHSDEPTELAYFLKGFDNGNDILKRLTDELAALIAQETQKGFDAGIRSERLWWAKNRNSVSFKKTGVFESRIAALEREEIQ